MSNDSKFAVLVNATTDSVGPAANGFEYALDLDDSDYHVEVYLDGAATQWPALLKEKPDHPVAKYYREVDERGLLAGACGYCADAFGVADDLETVGVTLLGGRENHAPHVGDLVDDGYELLTV